MSPRNQARHLIAHFVLLAALLLPVSAFCAELRLSAAASLTGAINELGAAFTELHPQARLLPNFASSGSLAKQLAAGAPADIFISANTKWMDYIVEQKVILAETVRPLLKNRLVVVGSPKVSAKELADLVSLQRVALCSPQSSPAGLYAQQALIEAGIYQPLLDAGKLVMAKDVRQALLYADRGEVDAAFVYATDALLARDAKVLFEVPQNLYPSVVYPVGLTVAGKDNAMAQAFMDYLKSEEAKGVFVRHGFVVAD